jgi:hypothetical protein
MSDKILDCSKLGDYEYEAIKKGFDMFMTPKSGPIYFGAVVKRDLKTMNRNFGYTDKRSFLKGTLFTAGAFWLGNKIKKHLDSKKVEKSETVPEEES